MTLHPGTRFVTAACFVSIGFMLPLPFQACEVLIGGVLVWIMTKPLVCNDPGHAFIKVWLTAGFFLTMIHGLHFPGGISIDSEGLRISGRSFFRIGALMVSFLWLARSVKEEELYAFFIDLRLPPPFIYLIFQTVFLIPRFGERAMVILTAQQARGFIFKGLCNRVRALFLIFPPMFASMLYELEETAASLSARGLHSPGRKSHLCNIEFGSIDLFIIIGLIILTCFLFFKVGS